MIVDPWIFISNFYFITLNNVFETRELPALLYEMSGNSLSILALYLHIEPHNDCTVLYDMESVLVYFSWRIYLERQVNI